MNTRLKLGKDRRDSGGFIGSSKVLQQLKEGPPRRRVGLIVDGAPARRTSSLSTRISMTLKVLITGRVQRVRRSSLKKDPLKLVRLLLLHTTSQAHIGMAGTVTSGIPSPTLSQNIAMGYVQSGHHKKGNEIKVEVRNKLRDAKVVGLPFVKARYFRA